MKLIELGRASDVTRTHVGPIKDQSGTVLAHFRVKVIGATKGASVCTFDKGEPSGTETYELAAGALCTL